MYSVVVMTTSSPEVIDGPKVMVPLGIEESGGTEMLGVGSTTKLSLEEATTESSLEEAVTELLEASVISVEVELTLVREDDETAGGTRLV